MKITFNNVHAYVDATPLAREWLEGFLTFLDRKKIRAGIEEHNEQFKGEKFYTGFTGMVAAEYKRLANLPSPDEEPDADEHRPLWIEEDDGFNLEDIRKRPCEHDEKANLDWLRPYQRAAVYAAAKRGRGVIKIPTAGGKTEVFTGITRALPCRWLFLVDSSKLMRDAMQRWRKRWYQHFGSKAKVREELGKKDDEISKWAWDAVIKEAPHLGVLGDGEEDLELETDRLVFATFQTLNARKDTEAGRAVLKWAQGVFGDECHTAAAATFEAVLAACKAAYYRIAVSGTPLDRGDNKNPNIVGLFGRQIYEISAQVLIQAKAISEPKINFVECDNTEEIPQPPRCKHCKGSGIVKEPLFDTICHCPKCKGKGVLKVAYPKLYKHGVVQSDIRNRLLFRIAKIAARPGILFVTNRQHGQMLAKGFQKRGISTLFIDGTKVTAQREEAVNALLSEEVDFVISSRVFRKGIDVPNLRAVINGAAGKSIIELLQGLGRGGRRFQDEQFFEFWDVFDTGAKSLRRQANERMRVLRREGYTVTQTSIEEVSGLSAL